MRFDAGDVQREKRDGALLSTLLAGYQELVVSGVQDDKMSLVRLLP